LFCENETNVRRHFTQQDAPGFFKDAFHEYVIAGNKSAVNPTQTGTKAGALYDLSVPAGGSVSVRLRLVAQAFQPASSGDFPVASSKIRRTGLESPVNPQTGMSALRLFTSRLVKGLTSKA
jgi:hypothetical protein